MLLRSFGLIAATLTLLLAPPAFGAKFADGTIVERVTSTATAAGTTTLTVSSTRYQRFTGSSTQTVVLPDATTLRTGITFSIMNESSGNVTVQYADASTAVVLTGGQSAELFLASNGSSNGTWNIRRPATLTSTETLTNKTLTSPTINTPTLNGSGGQLTLPAGPDTLVGKATTDTLTNKTIDADGTGNSITNIENADIKAGAAIARDKLASGTASHVVINDGTGVMSSEASLSISRGGTGQATATAGFDALAPTTTKGDLIVSNGTDNIRLAVGSDGQALVADSGEAAGVKWAAASGGGQGGINYLAPSSTTNSDLETSVGDWLAYADAAGTQPVDGNGGSPTLTCTRTTSSPLRGTGSLLITKDAANRQGEGCAAPFTIDRADLAKPLMVEFDYEVASGTYDVGSDTTDPDLVAYVYGPTDGTPSLIQLAPYKILGATSGTQLKFQGRFQTASSGVAYRLILHEAKTGTSAYTAKLDNIKVGPEQKSFGPPVTDWTSFTPTGSWSANTTYTGKWRRVGDSMEVQARLDLAGAPTAANLTVNLPSGYTVDAAKVLADTSAAGMHPAISGVVSIRDSSPATTYMGEVRLNDSSSVVLTVALDNNGGYLRDSAIIGATTPITFASGDSIVLSFTVPISGWSSTVQMSNDTDTRVVAAKYINSGSVAGSTSAPWDYATKVIDTHGAVTTGASWKFTAPVPGTYRVSVVGALAAGSQTAWIYKNGAQNSPLASMNSSTTTSGSALIQLVAGDYIDIRPDGAVSLHSSAQWSVNIERLSGPASIAASETVAATYTIDGGGQSLTSTAVLQFNTKVYDTHNAVTTGASWKFTAPVSGKYAVKYRVYSINIGDLASNGFPSTYRKNGTGSFRDDSGVSTPISGRAYTMQSFTVSLNAGDYIDIYNPVAHSAGSVYTGTNDSYISIERVGN